MFLNSLIIHHLIMITCISYEIMFNISLPKLINIAPLQTCVICVTDSIRHCNIAPGNPRLWRGVPVAPIQKSFGSSGRDWKPGKKLLIPCEFCTHRFIRYSSTCYGKVRIDPLMANIRNPDFFASPVVNAAWLVVVLPCYLNRDLLSGPKGKIVSRPNFFEIGLFGLTVTQITQVYSGALLIYFGTNMADIFP